MTHSGGCLYRADFRGRFWDLPARESGFLGAREGPEMGGCNSVRSSVRPSDLARISLSARESAKKGPKSDALFLGIKNADTRAEKAKKGEKSIYRHKPTWGGPTDPPRKRGGPAKGPTCRASAAGVGG